jgi:hypothetical protein
LCSGHAPAAAADGWQRLTDLVGGFASTKLLLPMAMAGVGLSVQTKAFAGVGWRPFAVGAAGAALVGGSLHKVLHHALALFICVAEVVLRVSIALRCRQRSPSLNRASASPCAAAGRHSRAAFMSSCATPLPSA